MTNEAKMLGISIMVLLGMNLLVVPVVEDGGNADLVDLTPPDSSILSPNFNVEAPTEGGSFLIPDSIESALSVIVQYISGIVSTITWFFGTIGSILFGGFTAHPLLALLNFIVIVVGTVSIIKIMPTT